LERDPNLDFVWHNKAQVFIDQGNYEKAVECYDEILDAYSDNPVIWNKKILPSVGFT
ncbi:MAG: tetratricopeptide repeat protein, partial [Methanotrichaceae archaeon]